MKIAVEGCAHGELENIYGTIEYLQKQNNVKIDLLLCCGDFQASRNYADLESMAVPPKYRQLCTFYKYYAGLKVAPILTILIGGNHEASSYFQELAYGGWVAPNIYYLGYAGVVNVAGIRIAGLSGIFKSNDYYKGRFESVPYTERTKRSCYHVRALDVFRLKQLSQPLNIMMSHDWPEGIYNHGNIKKLLSKKPYFKAEVESNSLGSQPAAELLHQTKPEYWFSAHLHVKFSALVNHDDGSSTKFLALDKCLPRRQFLQILDIPHEGDIILSYDLEWLSILQLTDHLTSVNSSSSYMPGPGCGKRWKFTPTDAEKEVTRNMLGGNLAIPNNFVQTAPVHDSSIQLPPPTSIKPNPQTTLFCRSIGIDDPLVLLLKKTNPKDDSYLEESLHNYSSFQTSGDVENLSASLSTPVKQTTPRTPLQLPAPRGSFPSTPLSLPIPLSSSSPQAASPFERGDTPVISDDSVEPSIPSTPVPPTPPESSEEHKSAEDLPIIIDTEGVDTEGIKVPTEAKRFRRRNFSMYSTSTDD